MAHAGRTSRGASAILLGHAARALRHVFGAGHADLAAIATHATDLPWETLTTALWSLQHQDTLGQLANARLPALLRLGLLGATPDPLHRLEPDAIAGLLEGFARQLIDNTETRLVVGGAMLAFGLGDFFLLRRIPAGSETA